jgi:hypothetical protein
VLFAIARRCDGLIAIDSVLSRGAARLYEKRHTCYSLSLAVAMASLLLTLCYRGAQLGSTRSGIPGALHRL